MITVRRLEEAEPGGRRVAIGMFDGVHVGHREVIDDAATVLTFDPHPLEVLHPAAAPKLLMPFELKREAVEELGVEELVVIEFDDRFAEIGAESFIDEVILARLGAEWVSVGENFRFGAKARGTTEMLAARPEFETRVVPLVEVDGEDVSSTRIRALVAAGEVSTARRLLGAPFTLRGTVTVGDGRGRQLGFPTANLVPDDRLAVPGHGVYAALAGGEPAAVNVGVRPTFDTGRGLLVEAHLIDHDADLYGQQLDVEFLERLRGEHRFPDSDSLVRQMHEDVAEARRACASFQRA